MANLYISEFQNGVSFIGTGQPQMMPQNAIVDQIVAIGGSSTQSAAFNTKTKAILLAADAACCIKFGDDPTATTSNFRIPANGNPFPFAITPGTKVAVIAA